MGFHIYCIAPADHPVPDDCAGLGDVRPELIEAAGLALWATAHPDRVPASVESIRRHNDVVVAAMTPVVTPVPVRYGQWFDDRATAAARLEEAAPTWRELLERFAGRAEYGVAVTLESGAAEQDVHPAHAQSGKEYMAALARKQAQAAGRRREGDRIATAFAARIGSLAAQTRVEQSRDGIVSLAHLVAWSDAGAYHTAVRSAAADAGVRAVPTGPWPPYSFVE